METTMNYLRGVGSDFTPDPHEPVMSSIFREYERVLVESLVTSFGLDFLIRDQHGGDVDTIHNVRQIGSDDQMTYKNKANERAYESQEAYSKSVKARYDSDKQFVEYRASVSQAKKDGRLNDAYTGQKVPRNADIDVDHVISTKEIHEDRGRVLAGLDGLDLANSRENLQPTDRSINTSMKEKSIPDYIAWLNKNEPQRNARIKELKSQPSLTDKERKELHKLEEQNKIDVERMKAADQKARKSYETKLAKAYYTSPKFAKDLVLAAGDVGVRMGARQALGFVFAEMWFAVKEEFQNNEDRGTFDLAEFCKKIVGGLKRGYENAKEKFSEIFSKFLSGSIAGALSSLTTTLCNIFFTTAKNAVRIIRQCFASLVEAFKTLFINPENYAFGDRIRAVLKILATGASVVVGTLVSEAVGKTPLGTIPVLGEVVQSFCGTFVTGIMSCTLLYFLDRSELANKLFGALNGLHTIETEIRYYREQADYFERFAAKLMQIDLDAFRREIALYRGIADSLQAASTPEELNRALKKAASDIGLAIPWTGDFNTFMANRQNHLVFG